MRALLAALFTVALFAGVIARLRRVAVPRFEPVARYAGGRVVLGRVVLARRGAPGRTVGWSVVCDGREVANVLSEARPLVQVRDEATLRVEDRTHARVIDLDAARCRVSTGARGS